MKLWLLTFKADAGSVNNVEQHSISVVAFTTCWVHLKLHQDTLDSLLTTFSTFTDSDIYWAKSCKEHLPIGCVQVANMDGLKRNEWTLLQLDKNFLLPQDAD